jgi:hypothetical protein
MAPPYLNKYESILYTLNIIALFVVLYKTPTYLHKHWYNNIYVSPDDDKCIISGYTYELTYKELPTGNIYLCLPLLLVNYSVNGIQYTDIKTNAYEYMDLKNMIRYEEFTESKKIDCINKLYNNNEYLYGNSIGRCLITYNHPIPENEHLCRAYTYEIYHEQGISDYGKYCQDGYNEGWTIIYWISNICLTYILYWMFIGIFYLIISSAKKRIKHEKKVHYE